jgi:hypothetical protein
MVNVNEEVACKKMSICTNKALDIDLGRYLDKVK